LPLFSRKRGKPSVITHADRARDAGQWELAATYYRTALRRKPKNPPIWVQYGHVLKESGHLAEAEQAYRTAVLCDPGSADPYLQLGRVLKIQGKKEEAWAAYLRAFALDPLLETTSFELAQLGWSGAHFSELRSMLDTNMPALPSLTSVYSTSAKNSVAAESERFIDRNYIPQTLASNRLSRHPTISAVIPCYNGARWLADALESVRSQTLPVHEIIVVDDASVDDSGDVARRCGATVIRNSRNRGEGFSRNVGLKHASGELIAWLDADDVWMPHHVNTVTGLLIEYPQATAAFGAVQRFGLRDELIQGYVPPGPPSNVFWLAFRSWVHCTIASIIHKTALLEIGGFNEQERYSVDFDLWLRLSRSRLFVCTHEVTSRWRWHDDQQSTQPHEQIAALYRFRRSYWERERAAGNTPLAAEMARRMADIWQQDMTAAWDKRDLVQLRFLNELAVLVPEIPAHRRLDWVDALRRHTANP
jgi:GT2 family glycosyltransferase